MGTPTPIPVIDVGKSYDLVLWDNESDIRMLLEGMWESKEHLQKELILSFHLGMGSCVTWDP